MTASPATASDELMRRYQVLIDHAELELDLAGRGEIEGLAAMSVRWDELVAALPVRPPREAAQALERAQLIHERTRVELLRLREALLAELSTNRRARRTAEGYGGALSPRPRVDRSV